MVTVLFADLVGYTAMSEQLDHESVKELTVRCLTRLAREVERFGGHVDQYIGDNVMAIFGAPVSHEDDPERAVRAGWGMQAAMSELNAQIVAQFGIELSLRVGINTGEVLAGHVGGEYTVFGDVVNVAARLQGAAPVGGILVGERTRRATLRAATFTTAGELSLKGKSGPVAAWRVDGVHDPVPPERLPPRAPLIGRGAELAQLEDLYARVARERAVHQLTIVGEAGIGKTRLQRELEQRLELAGNRFTALWGRSLPYGSTPLLWPVREMLSALCGVSRQDAGAAIEAKLLDVLEPFFAGDAAGRGQLPQRIAPLVRLLGSDAVALASAPAAGRDPRAARESFFAAVRAVFEALASRDPLILVWDDVHWADELTFSLIEYLQAWLRGPVLQVCLARGEVLERRHAWAGSRASTTTLALESLAQHDARELVYVLAQAAGSAPGASDELAERSGGNPLFAEALVERVAEADDGAPAELPDTVQGLLAARLDALGSTERRVLDHAAVFGTSFPEGALGAFADATGVSVPLALATLREKALIVFSGGQQAGVERRFAFKHALIREVAYEMLPKSVRARKHAQVAEFIEAEAGSGGQAVALLAEHYVSAARLAAAAHMEPAEIAALAVRALDCSEAAGDASASLYANQEALEHYGAAGSFAGDRADAMARIQEKQGDVLLRLGRTRRAAAVWSGCRSYYDDCGDALHVAQLHSKVAAALAQEGERDAAIVELQSGITRISALPESVQLARLFEEAANLHLEGGNNMWAAYAAERALRLSEHLAEPREAAKAHVVLGRVLGRAGDLPVAREHLERAVELARDHGAEETVRAMMAVAQNRERCDCDYDGAAGAYGDALDLAERIGDVPDQIELHASLARIALLRCDWERAERISEHSSTLAVSEGMVGKLCFPDVVQGRLRWREGDWSSSQRLLVRAHEVAEHGGWFEVSLPALLALAITYSDSGDHDSAERAYTLARAVCERAGFVQESVQLHASLAVARTLAGREREAHAAAQEAVALASRVNDPVNRASASEARALLSPPREASGMLLDAAAIWERLGRPLDVARCTLLTAWRLGESDTRAAEQHFRSAAKSYGELRVPHLERRAIALAQDGRRVSPVLRG